MVLNVGEIEPNPWFQCLKLILLVRPFPLPRTMILPSAGSGIIGYKEERELVLM